MKPNFVRDMLINLLLIFLGIFAIVKFYHRNLFLAIILAIISFAFIKMWNTKHDTVFYFIAAVIGPLAEIVCIHFGAWEYSNPSFLGIPAWLPFVWGISFLSIRRVSETIIQKFA
jgi:hypothetical protein